MGFTKPKRMLCRRLQVLLLASRSFLGPWLQWPSACPAELKKRCPMHLSAIDVLYPGLECPVGRVLPSRHYSVSLCVINSFSSYSVLSSLSYLLVYNLNLFPMCFIPKLNISHTFPFCFLAIPMLHPDCYGVLTFSLLKVLFHYLWFRLPSNFQSVYKP